MAYQNRKCKINRRDILLLHRLRVRVRLSAWVWIGWIHIGVASVGKVLWYVWVNVRIHTGSGGPTA